MHRSLPEPKSSERLLCSVSEDRYQEMTKTGADRPYFCLKPGTASGVPLKVFDVALDLLKRHSGIVWDPGRFRGIAPRRGREEVGEPCGRTRPNPHALAMPGATQLTVKSP